MNLQLAMLYGELLNWMVGGDLDVRVSHHKQQMCLKDYG